MDGKILKFSPLTEASFYILLALNNPNHGYGIIKEIQELTNDRVVLAPGTLYGVLTSFVKNKLIEIEKEESSRKKKTYRITGKGLELLHYEVNRLNELVSNAKEVLRK